MNGLAAMFNSQNRPAEAEKILRQVVDIRMRVLGPQHPRTLLALHDLAVSRAGQGKYSDAEEIERGVLAIEERVQGAAHADTLTARQELGVILSREGRLAEAESLLKQLVALRRSRPETNPAELADALYEVARVEALRRKRAAALDYLQ